MFVARIALLFIICIWVRLTSQETVKVTLYYEALCPYCHEFIQDQLYPGYETLGDSLQLDLVPYGAAKHKKVHGKWKFSCQHGPKECYANKLHACVLNKNYTQAESMNFIGCLMKTANPEKDSNAKKCAYKKELSWETIKRCANGEEGDELFAHYGDVTDSLYPSLEYVPHILFNDKDNQTLEDSARDNFVKTVCAIFTDRPSGC
ncbi:gamma-interferon-inducible lysosomal thiol reductase [Anoplophora glabripennis]|uniref:gamma-interferon-inducible lysosomal thiol reductase n=1 Tax=Anoplophora glabripennis TaxID=217634 RepID=UPI000874B4DD|nr:gamma-interferon-inducible lysosomal thiol reductase [Anoplophora glabripennis]